MENRLQWWLFWQVDLSTPPRPPWREKVPPGTASVILDGRYLVVAVLVGRGPCPGPVRSTCSSVPKRPQEKETLLPFDFLLGESGVGSPHLSPRKRGL